MANRILSFIDSTLNTRITPLAYLVAVHSFIFGASFVFFSGSPSVKATILYANGALVGVPVWGWMTMLGALALMAGMWLKKASIVSPASLAVFCAWIFAAITYAQNDYWLQMILAVVTTLYFGYHFLSVSLGRLWDYTPRHAEIDY